MYYVDLFCGAGGFSLGFERAGFTNLFSLDINQEWCSTYQANFPDHIVICKDINQLLENDIETICRNKKADVVIGGPPCQGFSIAGNIGRRFIDDKRNYLFKEFARIISILKPKYFVMENVARLYTHRGGQTREEIIEAFIKLDYNVEARILNAADYGVPQLRRRVFFIGCKQGYWIKFPEKNTAVYRTVGKAISHFPQLVSGETSAVPNHEAMSHTKDMLRKMGYICNGGNREQIPMQLRPKSGDVRKYIRYNSQKPSICVTGDMRKVFHYSQNRALTVRELACLQSFPDDFIFRGSKISQQQQVGNAVPPLLAEAVAAQIKKILKEKNAYIPKS